MRSGYPIADITAAMVDYSDGNVHDIGHFMRVYCYAKTIGELEELDDDTQALVEIAALVHDIACPLCRIKYGDASGKHQEAESEPLVRELLAPFDLKPEMTDRIAFIVSHHHTYDGVDGKDWRILLEADYIANAEENSWPRSNIASAREKIFETAAGRHLLDSVFPPQSSGEEEKEEAAETVPEKLKEFHGRRKRVMAQGVIAAATAAGVTVGAVPIPFSDAIILTPTESAEVNALAKIYGIGSDESGKQLVSLIVDNGTGGLAARALISGLKAIPGINVAASVINAVAAGTIIAAIGEVSVYVFEKISSGEKKETDTVWVTDVMEEKLTPELAKKLKPILESADSILDVGAIVRIVTSFISGKKSAASKKKKE